jgi:hypothetical protein
MQSYPILSLIVRFGTSAAIAVAVLVAGLAFWLLLGAMGWPAAIAALLIGAIVFVLAKSYVELVVLITEMLLPR